MARTRTPRNGKDFTPRRLKPARRPRRTPEEIERDKATDDAHVVMHNLHRDTPLDRLLCLPLEAIRTGLAFGLRREDFDHDEGERFISALARLFAKHPAIDSAIKEFCRTAMAARKRRTTKRDRV